MAQCSLLLHVTRKGTEGTQVLLLFHFSHSDSMRTGVICKEMATQRKKGNEMTL